jgi:UDP-N-acetylmuramoyl-tripeptide--D-alanyl-D-alanine ligase
MTALDHDRAALWSAEQAMAATGGTCDASFAARGVSIDSRATQPGDLFVALRGPRFDGHDFVADALARDAAAALVDHAPADVAPGAALLRVGDTFDALNDLGRAARARCRARIAAVTGSVGKTGTKEALRLVLSRQGRTAANEGSLNNHWGLPLSLARTASDERFAVLEMGMNHPGEITPLSLLARPHVALILNVEAVHSAFFGGIEEIADAKAEIFAGLEADGIAVLNRDDQHYERLAAAARTHRVGEIRTFGAHPKADVRVLDMAPGPASSRIRASLTGAPLSYEIGIAGRHWVTNSLAVLAVVGALGGDAESAARALCDMRAPEGRGARRRGHNRGDHFELIDEGYNASPVSMQAALAVLGQAPVAEDGRRIAVLGDMLELGDDAAVWHAEMADVVEENGIDQVFTAGSEMAHLWSALPSALRGGHAADSATLAPLVTANVRPGDVVMVKGSAGSRMGVIVAALTALDAPGVNGNPRRVGNGQ